ncbi:MAG: hypothetical protein JRI73_06610 [Deltaproteobacteria bacterium]|nr:hypothetical protein [Deltaproteobacteria bacterium]
MNIPKIIHQTWKERSVPQSLRSFVDSWKRHHPSWEYRLWDDSDNRQFIADSHPWFLRSYDNYSLDIQRADAVRYFILYTYGGLYVDLDFECLKSVEPLLSKANCVFGIEPEAHCRYHDLDRIISNAFMASIPRHPFFYAMTKELVTYVPQSTQINDFVLETTGPFMINRIYNAYPYKDGITLLPSHYLFPLDYKEAELHLKGRAAELLQPKLKMAYGIHYHLGSWWKDKSEIP